jgi:hypothetical protein
MAGVARCQPAYGVEALHQGGTMSVHRSTNLGSRPVWRVGSRSGAVARRPVANSLPERLAEPPRLGIAAKKTPPER